jgi:hypothetical protein
MLTHGGPKKLLWLVQTTRNGESLVITSLYLHVLWYFKIFLRKFTAHKLLEKRKRVGQFITVNIIVRRDVGR